MIAAGGVSSGAIEPSVLVGMIAASCIPTTIASNVVMTRNSGGDEAAAIIEVVLGNVIGAFLAPWLIYAYLPSGPDFDSLKPAPPSELGPMYASVMMQLGLSVLVPLVVGQVLRWTWPRQVTLVLRTFYLAPLCSLLMATLVWYVFILASRRTRSNRSQVYLFGRFRDRSDIYAAKFIHRIQYFDEYGRVWHVYSDLLLRSVPAKVLHESGEPSCRRIENCVPSP